MRSGPGLYYSLPHRVAGSFGNSPVGQIAEWITASWARFGAFVSWLVIVAVVLSGAFPVGESALILITSPILAVFLYGGTVLAGWIAYFIPLTGFLFGVTRLCCLRLFCRLIVQQAPQVEIPLWHSRRSN